MLPRLKIKNKKHTLAKNFSPSVGFAVSTGGVFGFRWDQKKSSPSHSIFSPFLRCRGCRKVVFPRYVLIPYGPQMAVYFRTCLKLLLLLAFFWSQAVDKIQENDCWEELWAPLVVEYFPSLSCFTTMLGFSKPAGLTGEAVNNCSRNKSLSLFLQSDILAINTLTRSPNSSLSMPEAV